MIQRVFQPKRKHNGRSLSRENYRGRYKLPGMAKLVDVALYTTEKRVAEQRLAQIVKEAQQEAAGIIAPKAMRDAAQRPLADHLANCVADLKAMGRAKTYYRLVEVRVTRLLKECGWTLPRDVTTDSFLSWRIGQPDMAAKTSNDYLDAAGVLLNWMQRQGRILANPLRAVVKVQTAGQEKIKRRAFTDDEVRRLLGVSESRRPVYLMAILTGLRRGELKAMRWDDIHLDAPKPFVNARASTTKNRKTAVIFLRDDLVAELRRIRPINVSPAAPVFRVPKGETVRADFKRVGIPRFDAVGRRVDLHAMRHTLATNLGRGGVAPRVAMELMRHSDIRLTAKTYTDAGLLETADAMDKLPRFDASPQVAQATGTDGIIEPEKRSLSLVAEGRKLSSDVAGSSVREVKQTPENKASSRDLSQTDATGRRGPSNESDGARTRNLRIDSPVL